MKYKDEGINCTIKYCPERGQIAVLNDPIFYDTNFAGTQKIDTGFESDGASIPRWIWWLIGHPFDIKYLREAIAHDHLYRVQICTRKQADRHFLKSLKKRGFRVRRWLVYFAVRAFGWIAWNKHKRKHK